MISNVVGWINQYHTLCDIDCGFVFQSNTPGDPLTLAIINQDLKKVAKFLGNPAWIDALTSHAFRRSGACMMLAAGKTAEQIKWAGGWLSGQYLSYMDEDLGSVSGSAAGEMLSTMDDMAR